MYGLVILGKVPARKAGAMRILIAGTSGSGKTTFAQRLGAILGIPHTEMDSLHWGENWTPRPSFEADVDELAAQDSWIRMAVFAGA